ncbi:hypothetical protein [Paraburkholderia saeva]|uniref:hypothetical protein n=1 Tax=Paraburkholderia saeva TaxID=2777537 RepID=UPI001DD1D916|nr:hypothetical protein [Paraburkholderia saeva]CAG4906847.1 hypothetical protein R52603_03461 [Paraburkholderia saeva]
MSYLCAAALGYQEIREALLFSYYPVHREIANAAAFQAKLAPTDISFVRVFHVIQREMAGGRRGS